MEHHQEESDSSIQHSFAEMMETLESYSYQAEKRSYEATLEDDSSSEDGDETLNVSASPIPSPTVHKKVTARRKLVKYEEKRTPGKRSAKSPLQPQQVAKTPIRSHPNPVPGQDQPLPHSLESSPDVHTEPPPTDPRREPDPPIRQEPEFFLHRSAWYTVSTSTLLYCLDPSGPPPLDWERTRARWLNDCWGHLVDPDPRLTIRHFILAIPESMSHDDAWPKIRRASHNLELAKWRPSSWTAESWRQSAERPFEIPPFAGTVGDQPPALPSGLEELTQHIAVLQSQISEGQQLMVTAVNKFTAIAEGSIRDSSQCMRSIFDNSFTRLHSIADHATSMAIPLPSPVIVPSNKSTTTPASSASAPSAKVIDPTVPPKIRKKPGKSKPLV
ncbi:hypothetical protein 2 [Solanum melongena rhabdo-like virus]|uniref:hypothetical protein 2 n=1 Tax=Solanum melongena rhabdo-like virus TaxID=2740120 RepID=UPI00248208F3|nr:hypothetical protein 2 [Solanum melongena rhabdo-like virus]QKI29231.1 hypothetical protein 2 [Solanum melongena rhabdo-like virus]